MPAELSRVEAVFNEAVSKSAPAERAAYLDQACGGDAELRERVERLLASHDAAGSFMATPDPARTLDPYVPLQEGPGAKIGRYKLIQQIGEGGFGVVFMAEQEFPVRRLVALKIIKLGMDTRQVVARFEAERQALAMMDHPSVAKVLDGGATETGRPYFVMELVKGAPITAYCDKNNLSIPQRLELFAQVCQAVQHAHQKGLIHRDIKPSNVLVATQDDRPVAKVIDFGIAKAMQARLTEKTLFTDFRQLIGTPEYMSPEQAEGDLDIDTRCDVYSLGVLLYELLAGSPPFDPKELRSKAFAEMQRIIREVEPPAPSTRLSTLKDVLPTVAAQRGVEPRKLQTIVRGELDWIVMRCLEKDRKRRYETASALAEDIQHYLTDQPVQARPATRRYRMKKFIRRNRGAVTAGALVVLALVLGLTAATAGFVNARRQRNIALSARAAEAQQRQVAQARFNDVRTLANKFMLDFHAKIENLPGSTPAVKMLVETSLDYLNRLAVEAGDDPELQRDLIVAYRKIGDIQMTLGDLTAAQESYRRGFLLAEPIAAAHPDDWRAQDELRALHQGQGRVLSQLGKHSESSKEYQAGLEIARRIAAAHPNESAPQLAIGSLLQSVRGIDNARAAREIYAKLAASDKNNVDALEALAGADRQIGDYLRYQADSAGAVASYYKAIDTYQKLVDASPNSTRLSLSLAGTRIDAGTALSWPWLGGPRDPSAAVALFASARETIEPLAEADRLNAPLQRQLALIYNQTGILRVRERDTAGSLPAFRRFREIAQRLVDLDKGNVDSWCLLEESIWRIGDALGKAGDFAGSVETFTKLLDMARTTVERHHGAGHSLWWLAETHNGASAAMAYAGDLAGSVENAEKAAELFRQVKDVRRVVDQLKQAGYVRMMMAEDSDLPAQQRASLLQKAKENLEQSVSESQRMQKMADLSSEQTAWLTRTNKATELLKQCLESQRVLAIAATQPATAAGILTRNRSITGHNTKLAELQAMDQQALSLVQQRKIVEALALREKLVEAASGEMTASDPRMIRYRLSLAELLIPTHRFTEAESQLLMARLGAREAATDPGLNQAILEKLENLYRVWGLGQADEPTAGRQELADTMKSLEAQNQLARRLREEKRLEEAAAIRKHVVDLARRALPPGDVAAARYELDYADLLIGMKRFDEAESELLDALKRAELARSGEAGARARQLLVALYGKWNKPEQAAHYQTLEERAAAASRPESGAPGVLTGGRLAAPVLQAEDAQAIVAAMGQDVAIEGVIRSAAWSGTGKVMIIEFKGVGRKGIHCASFSAQRQILDAHFGDDAAATLTGATVRIRGKLSEHNSRPQIIITDPRQIEILRPSTGPAGEETRPGEASSQPGAVADEPGRSRDGGPTSQPRPSGRTTVLRVEDRAGLLAARGSEVSVEGTIQSAIWNPTNTVMQIEFSGVKPPNGFCCVIFRKHRRAMDDHFGGDADAKLNGATVRIRGRVSEFNHRPQIIIDDPRQIESFQPVAPPHP